MLARFPSSRSPVAANAIVEQVIRDLEEGPLAHLPSGSYAANAAWIACAVIAFDIARASAVAASMRTPRWATLRTKIINVPRPNREHEPAPGPTPFDPLALGHQLGTALVARDKPPAPTAT